EHVSLKDLERPGWSQASQWHKAAPRGRLTLPHSDGPSTVPRDIRPRETTHFDPSEPPVASKDHGDSEREAVAALASKPIRGFPGLPRREQRHDPVAGLDGELRAPPCHARDRVAPGRRGRQELTQSRSHGTPRLRGVGRGEDSAYDSDDLGRG